MAPDWLQLRLRFAPKNDSRLPRVVAQGSAREPIRRSKLTPGRQPGDGNPGMINYQEPDLTQHPPRSPRVKLGGFVHLPRLLDKTRAHLANKLGDYIFPCPLDQRVLAFMGIKAETWVAAVQSGKSDSAMLAWVMENLSPSRLPHEIAAWSSWLESVAPGDAQRHANFAEQIKVLAPDRSDIVTTFDRLELDDYVSFGGQG